MRSLLTLLLLTIHCTCVRAQKVLDFKNLNPDEILSGKDELSKILLVGSFYFNYPTYGRVTVGKEAHTQRIVKQ